MGIVANHWYCGAETGLGRGFQSGTDDCNLSSESFAIASALGRRIAETRCVKRWLTGSECNAVGRRDADDVCRRALTWLERRPARPFFMFLNFFDAHDPYVAPDEFASRPPVTARHEEVLANWWNLDKSQVTANDAQFAVDNYRDCLAFLDDRVGTLLEELELSGVLDNTIVIITADHGEHFGDHGLYGHGNSLYQSAVRVPLLVRWPSRVPQGVVEDRRVSLRELSVTVADLISRPNGSDGDKDEYTFRGCSWLKSAGQDYVLSEIDSPSIFPCCHGRSPVFQGPMKALYHGPYKYIRTGLREELYDLNADPDEQHDLFGSALHVDRLESFRKELTRRFPAGTEAP